MTAVIKKITAHVFYAFKITRENNPFAMSEGMADGHGRFIMLIIDCVFFSDVAAIHFFPPVYSSEHGIRWLSCGVVWVVEILVSY